MAGTDEVEIRDNGPERRFEAWLGDRLAGFSRYALVGDRVVFTHTEVDPAFGGRGIGSRLAAEALDAVRESGRRVTPRCPFIARYVQEHPGYEDIIAWPPARPARDRDPDVPA